MSTAPAPQNSSLEERLATLEDSIVRINEYNQQVTTALKHMLDQSRRLEELPRHINEIQQRLENYRSAQALARASQIFPKNRSVVFVGKGYFGGNTKYGFLAFCEYARDKNVQVHFVTDDPHQCDMLKRAGLPCIAAAPHQWSIEDVRTLFGAKVAVLDDNFHWQSMQNVQAWGMLQGAKTIQLWHGIPIKEIGMRYVLRGDNVILDELVASAGPFDLFVAPGMAAREEWAERFAFRNFAALGYPRNDVLLRQPSAHDLINVDLETLKTFQDARRIQKPCIIYTPTYRDDSASTWFAQAGIDRFVEHARAKNYAFAINLHPYEQVLLEATRAHYPGVRFIAPGTDIYPIVRCADVLVTDYSSLAFDFLLLDRPLVFYRPTGDKVVVQARGFIQSRVNETPGEVATNVEEFIAAVDKAVESARAPGSDPHRQARQDLRGRLFDYTDAKSSERLCEKIMSLVEA